MDGVEAEERSLQDVALRGALGGFLMGLANLVPGISGGTMLLAAGVYPDFIQAIADLTRLRFHLRAVVVLGAVGGAAALAILFGAGLLKDLVLTYRWVMYSLFIGLTLGGVPLVWGLIGRFERRAALGTAAGFLGMAALALAQARGGGTVAGEEAAAPMLLLGGIAGASAMILPGVSGGYLLLVLGLYVPILAGIDAFKDALKGVDLAALLDPLFGVVVPVGAGVVLGVGLVSNAVKWLLDHHRSPTLGVLLGLLVGAVVGLWPFQRGIPPEPGDVVKGRVMTPALIAELDPEDYPVRYFAPSGAQVAGSLGLVVAGFAVTGAVAWLGRRKERNDG